MKTFKDCPDVSIPNRNPIVNNRGCEFRVDRPWGWFDAIVENADGITVKVLHIRKTEQLSLQRHQNRDQKYYIIDDMIIKYEDENHVVQTVEARSGDTFYFKRGTLHQALNPGPKEVVRFFEVCWGVNNEEDIERLDDVYGRGNGKEAQQC